MTDIHTYESWVQSKKKFLSTPTIEMEIYVGRLSHSIRHSLEDILSSLEGTPVDFHNLRCPVSPNILLSKDQGKLQLIAFTQIKKERIYMMTFYEDYADFEKLFSDN